MPVDPHIWAGDFLTATLLDSDLYLYNGLYFTPNGIRFHARRPIYKAYNGATTSNTTANGNYCLAFGNSGNTNAVSSVIVDTPGLVGGWFDPFISGNIRLNHLTGGGGGPGIVGGLAMMIGYSLWPAVAGSGSYGSGLGVSTGSTPTNPGTIQATNTNHDGCAVTIDLVDGNAQQWALFGFNNTGGSLAPSLAAHADGSGETSKLMSHWVSVYPVNGFTVASLPAPVPNWTSSTPALTSALLNGNTGLRDPLRFLNMPPLARADAQGLSTQPITANTATTVTINATSGMVTYNSFASNTFTAPFQGLYFVHGYVACQNFSGNLRAGVNVNGTDYFGPYTPMAGSGNGAACKSQIFSLNAGDTVTLRAFADAAASTSTNNPSRLVVIFVGQRGTPAPLPVLPDTTFRWTAGQPGPNATAFNQHVANDLIMLTKRPYLMAYQTVQQTLTPGTEAIMSMDTLGGIVHGDGGDNYSGWTPGASNKYTAQVAGWYMAVMEGYLQAPTLTATPNVLGALALNPFGIDPYARYQQQNLSLINHGGASAVSYYYLRPGDTIQPVLLTKDSSATTINTSTAPNSHFELVWLGE